MSCSTCKHILPLVRWCGLLTVRKAPLRYLPANGCPYWRAK